jgi:hypothetical protein
MKYKTKILSVLIVLAIMFLVHACANRAQGPTGGPKDKTPPSVLRSTPGNGALNYKKKSIEIDFDKIVTIEKPNENVIISPPQQKQPDVKSLGRKVVVNFNEPLKDSTTYSINFGNAIADVNEKNVIKNYLFSFSTGNTIDTLKVSGTVINAEDLNPLQGIIVGIYRETADSVFSLLPFMRIGRTDENGRFTIDNIKTGRYKVYALGDTNQDYMFQPGEGLAFRDSLVAPYTRIEQMQDTIWKDSTTVDSVRTYMGTRFLPDNISLRYFKEDKKRQYFVKYERKEPFVFSLFFNTSQAKLPELKPLNFNWDGKYLLQANAGKDSLTYWIRDSVVWKNDTLKMTMSYLKTDSLFHLKPITDTINVSMRKAHVNTRSKANKKVSVGKIEPLKFTTNMSSVFEIYNPIMLNFEAPLEHSDFTMVKLFQKVDTVFKQIPFKWRQVDSTKMAYAIDIKWKAETSYELRIDSAAFTSIYKKVSSKLKTEFKIRSLEEYSSVKLLLATFNPKAIIQILDSKDVILASKPAREKGTIFEYLRPGDYYMRMFLDENGNGKWDTGDFSKKLQPEEVYYYPKKMTLMANWEFEETWDVSLVPLLEQKPLELIKLSVKKTPGSY